MVSHDFYFFLQDYFKLVMCNFVLSFLFPEQGPGWYDNPREADRRPDIHLPGLRLQPWVQPR